MSATPDLIQALRRPDHELEETHISWVLLGTDLVWKIKKPVDLGFVDFTRLKARREACEAEVRLNRRLSPDVYLGVVPITSTAGTPRLGGSGEPIEYAVEMRRLPRADRLDVRLRDDRLDRSDIVAAAERIASFHREVPVSPREVVDFETLRHNVLENFDQLDSPPSNLLDRRRIHEVQGWQLGVLANRTDRFRERIARGRAREGHGDLRLEHIYRSDDGELSIIDCIEFNERFRHGDVCADLAFLAMDLSWHDRPDLSELLLASYATATLDYDLYSVVDFFQSYRALVRAKISAMLADRADLPQTLRDRHGEEARRYLQLAFAVDHEPLQRPVLLAVGGMIAAGKSTLASELGRRLALPVIATDRVRKFQLGVEESTPIRESPFSGRYGEEQTNSVYESVLDQAASILAAGRGVILDATFRSRRHREAARRLADDVGAEFRMIECVASEQTIRRRLADRRSHQETSDATLDLYDDFLAAWEPIAELGPEHHVVCDLGVSAVDAVQQVVSSLEQVPPVTDQG